MIETAPVATFYTVSMYATSIRLDRGPTGQDWKGYVQTVIENMHRTIIHQKCQKH